MATCKDCLHVDVCSIAEIMGEDYCCEGIKDRTKIVELPWKVGDTVYICTCFGMWYAPHEIDKCEMKVTRITIANNTVVFEAEKDKYNSDTFIQRQIGKTVFLTKKEAEQALRERDKDARN